MSGNYGAKALARKGYRSARGGDKTRSSYSV